MKSATKPSTLEEIESYIATPVSVAELTADCPIVLHKGSGLSFRVAPMNYHDLQLWRHMKDLAAKDKRDLSAQTRADRFLLLHAVCVDGGEPISEKVADYLLAGPDFGTHTVELLEAAAHQNPPREEQTPTVLLSYGFARATIVLVQELQSAGLFDLLRERQGGDSKSLDAWLSTMPFWGTVLEAEEAAREIGIERAEGAAEVS